MYFRFCSCVTCSRRSDSRAREKNSPKKKRLARVMISFKYSGNSEGPKIEPRGTALLTFENKLLTKRDGRGRPQSTCIIPSGTTQ